LKPLPRIYYITPFQIEPPLGEKYPATSLYNTDKKSQKDSKILKVPPPGAMCLLGISMQTRSSEVPVGRIHDDGMSYLGAKGKSAKITDNIRWNPQPRFNVTINDGA